MERDHKPKGIGITRRALGAIPAATAAGLAAVLTTACGSEYAPNGLGAPRQISTPARSVATAFPTVGTAANLPLTSERLLANYMEQLASEMKQLEANNAKKNLNEVSDNDLNLYIEGFAKIYSIAMTGGIVAPSEYIQATKIVKREEFDRSFDAATKQRRIIAGIPDTWILVSAQDGKGQLFINRDSFYFTHEGMRSVGFEDNALMVFGGALSVAYDRVSPSLVPKVQPRTPIPESL